MGCALRRQLREPAAGCGCVASMLSAIVLDTNSATGEESASYARGDSGSFVSRCACVSWVAIKVVELKLPVHPP